MGSSPVIHAFFRTDPVGGRRVDGRIKPGRDNFKLFMKKRRAFFKVKPGLNRTAAGQARA